jgi:hypothetical protein
MPTLDNHENWCWKFGEGWKEAQRIADEIKRDTKDHPHVCKVRDNECDQPFTSTAGKPLTFLSLGDDWVKSSSGHKYCVHRFYTNMKNWDTDRWENFIDNIGGAELSSDLVSVFKQKVMDKIK